MENNILDKFIRNMLIHLNGGDPGDSWSQLSEKMDHATPSPEQEVEFDNQIKASIADLSVIEMADWENFLPSLELDENLEAIEQDLNLDATAKEKLDTIDEPYDPSTWNALSQKLDLAEVLEHENADSDLDQVAYDNLLNYTVPQRAGDWEALEKELDKDEVLPLPLLYKFKLIELASLTFLLLIFFQFSSSSNDVEVDSTINNIAAIEIPLSSDPVVISARKADNLVNDTKANTKANLSLSSKRTNKPNKIETKKAITKKSIRVNKPTISSNYLVNNKKAINNNIPADVIIEVASETTPVISAKTQQTKKENSTTLVVIDQDDLDRGIGSILSTARLPMSSLVNLDYKEKDVHFCKSCYNLGSLLRWRLGAHLDGKFENIMTAYDKILNLDSYNHLTFSYGAGLSTSILLGNWELESGFTYISRQYDTKASEVDGSLRAGFLRISLDKIQMNVLSVPLNLRYHFKSKNAKTHFYLHAGASMNVATQANYFITSEYLSNAKRPSLTESSRIVKQSDFSSDKIYQPGWFEGGSYLENRYFTANLGFGFERKVSARYSIFGQSTYAHYLDNKGLGPNDDRFNSLGFSTGIRALFK